MAKFIPKFIQPVLNYVPDAGVDELTSYASKAIRAKIVADRHIRGFEKADRKGGPDAYEFESAKPKTRAAEKAHRTYIKENREVEAIDNSGYVSEEEKRLSRVSDEIQHYITIVDIDYDADEFRRGRNYKYIQLPFVPRELVYYPESSFVGIASFGRNNPYYQFTGSEDTLTFTIDWHSNQLDRKDVIANCRWVEALTKGDGYRGTPHRVELIWGEDNSLFSGVTWAVVSAPYTLSQFVKGYRDPQNGSVVNVGMLPQQAIQTVTLKRLTSHNLLSQEIINGYGKR